ncbi:MAG: hypothetical protein AB8H03_11605 [Saprospiraceae bacterium]
MEEKKNQIGDWLEQLQRESWNLELLVSGFSIFLLMQAYQGLIAAFQYINLNTGLDGNLDGMLRTLVGILLLGSIVLTINLVVHVFLRGFWIGAVGLRSVQSKIDLDKLGYSEYFTEKLKTRVPSLDRMLEKLDTLSSVIFSFTFLIVFMFFSLFMFLATISLFVYFIDFGLELLDEDAVIRKVINKVAISVLFAMLLAGIIYAIDTLTLGFFKKYNRLSRLYFPIYKWIGKIIMAGIYRSIYYSLISRFPKNYIRVLLSVYVLLFFLIPFIKYDQYIYYPDNGSQFKLSSNEYDDIRNEEHYIGDASISSQIVSGSFLPLFIRYSLDDNEVLEKICKDFVPMKKDGFNSGIEIGSGGINLNDAFVKENEPGKALKCFSDLYVVEIDSIKIETDFYFSIHPNQGERGVQTMLEIDTLQKGKHEIYIQKKKLNRKDEVEDVGYSRILFWKE